MKVAIIGAGPAGLFAAYELSNSKGIEVFVIDKGKSVKDREGPINNKENTECYSCEPCDIVSGVGGAGTFSDGKLNLTHRIGGDPKTLKRNPEETQKYIDFVDKVLEKYGAPKTYTGANGEEVKNLEKKAKMIGIEFISGKQKHIGTEKVKEIIQRFYEELVERGVNFLVKKEVKKIEKNNHFILITDKEKITADFVIAAPGRAGAYWLREQAHKLGVKTDYGPIDVGVRIEFSSEIYEKIKDVMYDAKFRLYTETYDDMVRTFCTNPGGFVSKETYDSFVLVNGHAKKNEKSNNTNLSLLTRISLTNPVEDTTLYGRSIAKLATTIGGGKPILQRYKDLRKGRRSTWERIKRSSITPTLTDVTPGDISMALPQRIVTNIIESLEKLDSIIPGLASDSTLIYAPEIKFYDTLYTTNEHLETNLENFFVAGDASGHSRGIIYAAVTGKIAAEGVLRKIGDLNENNSQRRRSSPLQGQMA